METRYTTAVPKKLPQKPGEAVFFAETVVNIKDVWFFMSFTSTVIGSSRIAYF
jgi:hypothetical protein